MGDHTFENVLRGFFARHYETDISRSRVPVTSLCALISVAGKFDSHIALYLPLNGFVSLTQDFLSLALMMIVLIVYAALRLYYDTTQTLHEKQSSAPASILRPILVSDSLNHNHGGFSKVRNNTV